MDGKAKNRFRTVSYAHADTCYLLLVGLLPDSHFPFLGFKTLTHLHLMFSQPAATRKT